MKTRLIVLMAVALTLVVAGCSSDPTTSDEYTALEEYVDKVTAEWDSLTPSEEVTALVEEWLSALQRDDGSVVDIYRVDGFHLNGIERYELDELEAHLTAGEKMATTPPVLITDQGDGRYVVTRGFSDLDGSNASAVTYTVITDYDGTLKLAYTEWTHILY